MKIWTDAELAQFLGVDTTVVTLWAKLGRLLAREKKAPYTFDDDVVMNLLEPRLRGRVNLQLIPPSEASTVSGATHSSLVRWGQGGVVSMAILPDGSRRYSLEEMKAMRPLSTKVTGLVAPERIIEEWRISEAKLQVWIDQGGVEVIYNRHHEPRLNPEQIRACVIKDLYLPKSE
jgi:predicted site-specific integrase-resolvase